jgi:hypothetical protein
VVKLAAQDRYLARSRTYEPGSYFSHGGQRSHEPLLLTSAVARVKRAGCPVIVSSLYLWCPWKDSNLQSAAQKGLALGALWHKTPKGRAKRVQF